MPYLVQTPETPNFLCEMAEPMAPRQKLHLDPSLPGIAQAARLPQVANINPRHRSGDGPLIRRDKGA